MPFRNLIGHRRVSMLLARAIAADSLPPSLLFSGPDGVGKGTFAMAAAEALNCLAPVRSAPFAVDACGRCGACRRIAARTHPDVLTVTPGDSGSIKIETIRDAVQRTAYKPFEARKRVVIVDDAEAMAGEAQNALLKTLEEPPSGSMFVLVTSMPELLLPTVRSRCARLRFGRLNVQEIAAVLTGACRMKPADAQHAAPLGEGSVTQALRVQAKGGAASRAAAHDVLKASARGRDDRQRLALAKELVPKESGPPAELREHLADQLRMMAGLLRDVAVLNSRADTRMLANADLEAELVALSQAFDSPRAVRAFTAVDQALGALDRNASPKVVADWLVLQL